MFGIGKKEDDGVARINVQLAQVTNQKNEYLMELGKYYYEENFEKEQIGEYKRIIDNIKSCDNRTQELNDELLKLQGLVRCSSCKASVPLGSAFCNHCGAKIENTAGEDFSLCAGCGKSFDISMAFCPYCGKKRGEEA